MSERESSIWLRRSSREPRRWHPSALAARKRVVLLVHGFNVSEPSATRTYARFKAALSNYATGFESDIVSVHWPRDGPPVLSSLFYAASVRTAMRCAADLKEYIESLVDIHGRPPQIVVVAHSLGSRLVIEALTRLTSPPARAVRLVVMAAAYPVAVASARAAALSTLRPMVMYSPSDWVLSRTFPLGEWLGGGGGAGWPEAVGLFGLPARGAWSTREQMHGFDHGAYWSRDSAAAAICVELGFTAPVTVAAREIAQTSIPGREPGECELPIR